jgi:hypothetical protein
MLEKFTLASQVAKAGSPENSVLLAAKSGAQAMIEVVRLKRRGLPWTPAIG